MSSGKIIQINPDLFQISKKTKKNRSEKQKISIPKPIIGTSSIKHKLLNRIKQKKTEENNLNKKNISPKMPSEEPNSSTFEKSISFKKRNNRKEVIDSGAKSNFSGIGWGRMKDQYEEENENVEPSNEYDETENELSSAIDYFDNISKREKEKEKLLNKTYKNRINTSNNTTPTLNNISLNIPYQLKSTSEPYTSVQNNNNINSIVNNILDDLPYGCLKGGMKPTYKKWINSVKNYSSMSNTDRVDAVRPPTPPKKRPEEKVFTENEYKESLFTEPDKHKENILKKQIDDKLKKIESEQQTLDDMDNEIEPIGGDNVSDKKYVKKITKRKYTLGKSIKYRKVGVLIKGRQTKKNIINSHKKLKQTDIHQIKKYLKKHGILKIGSLCPDEILRKIYESVMLSGEVNNINKNTLIHNFLNDDEIK